jgi:hypothetical protein
MDSYDDYLDRQLVEEGKKEERLNNQQIIRFIADNWDTIRELVIERDLKNARRREKIL